MAAGFEKKSYSVTGLQHLNVPLQWPEHKYVHITHVEIGGGHPFVSLLICMHFHLICMLASHVTINGTHITALNRAWLVFYTDMEDEQTVTFANTLFICCLL